MLWKVDIWLADRGDDHAARDLLAAAGGREPGLAGDLRTGTGWLIEGAVSREEVDRLAATVLADPITESFAVHAAGASSAPPFPDLPLAAHVLPRRGVTDPAAETARAAFALVGVEAAAVRSLRTLWLPPMPPERAEQLARRFLASDAIHDVVVGPLPLTTLLGGSPWSFTRRSVRLEGLDDAGLAALSRERCLALTPRELGVVRDHFRDLGRDPFEIELESIAQTWSEHCCHKTLTGGVVHRGPAGEVRYGNLLKETVFAATQAIRERLGGADWCVSVFRDNSGVVRFDGDHDLCVKVETHNHPSAIEPYGGAATGLGGVIRDVLGTGRAARPIASLDVFCVGPPDTAAEQVPEGVLPPRRLLAGVVAGVRDYGNRMGIPTIAGSVAFDPGYLANPLVFCGTVGLMPRHSAEGEVHAGDLVVVAGGKTGRDGIHGATFSSIELSSTSEQESGGAVQIGHAINEKMLVDFVLESSRRRLFTAITDCGAGGLSSAVGEMAATLGAEVDLEQVPLKYDGLSATEVWISEAQERMVLAVPPDCWEAMRQVADAEGVEATVIGRFTGNGRLVLRWAGELAGELDCHFLHEGRPRDTRRSRWEPPTESPWRFNGEPLAPRFGQIVLDLLALPDVASKEWIIRQYDHEVQGASVVKPLLGPGEGPADGTVVRGVLGRPRGVVLGVGLRHRLGRQDPYQMTAGGIVEAIANVVAAGADPSRVALLDNFCWGETKSEAGLGGVVEACRACQEMAMALDAPFVSGKDSLNNVFTWRDGQGEHELSIPPTLLATALGQIDDAERCLTPAVKVAGNPLYLVGHTGTQTAGSQLELLGEVGGGPVPRVDPEAARRVFAAIYAAAAEGLIAACHDLSDGGLVVAAAEMTIAGGLGCRLDLAGVPIDPAGLPQPAGDDLLDLLAAAAETPARFLCEVPAQRADEFEGVLAALPIHRLGEVGHDDAAVGGAALRVDGRSGRLAVIPLAELAAAWRSLPFA